MRSKGFGAESPAEELGRIYYFVRELPTTSWPRSAIWRRAHGGPATLEAGHAWYEAMAKKVMQAVERVEGKARVAEDDAIWSGRESERIRQKSRQ